MALVFQDTFTDADGVLVGTAAGGSGHAPDSGADATRYRGNSNGAPASALINVNACRCSVGDPHNDFHRIAVAIMTGAAPAEFYADVKPIQTTVYSIVELLFRFQGNISPLTGLAAEYDSVYLIKSANPSTWQVYCSYGPWAQTGKPTPLTSVPSAFGPGFSALLNTLVIADGNGTRIGATRYQQTELYDLWTEPYGGGARTFIGSFTFPSYAEVNHKGVGIAFNGPSGSTVIIDVDNLAVDNVGSGSTPPPPTFTGNLVTRLLRYTSLAAAQRLSIGNYGQSSSGGPGGGGSGVRVTGYQSAIGYSCVKFTVTGNGNPFGANGFQEQEFSAVRIQAAHMFAPHPVCNRIYRFVDVVMARVTQANAAPQPTSRVFWGLYKAFGADAKVMDDGWIGFYTQFIGLVAGNWIAKVGNDAETVLLSQDTGIAADSPHQLRVDLNGPSGAIEFYIDGVKKATYTVQSGQLGGVSATAPGLGCAGNAGFAGGTATILEVYHSTMSDRAGMIFDEVPV